MLTEKLQDFFMSIGKSYEHEESQLGILLGELETVRGLVSEFGESRIVEEVSSWEGSDSFEWYWLYVAGFKSAYAELEAYLGSKDLTQQLYAAIALANENSQVATSKLEALKVNTEANIEEFGFNGARDENDLFYRIEEQIRDKAAML